MQLNKYELVHIIAKRAKEAQIESRDMLNTYSYSPIAKKREKRNFVKEAFDEVMEEIKKDNV